MILQKDIVVVGGGIAGLWLLQRLLQAGFDAVLLERQALGEGQTIASQGMIHGGLKYALGGGLTGASEAIAEMPAHWARCLRGEGELDLRGTRVLSSDYYLWPSEDLRSRLTAFLGSKLVSSKVTAVAPADYPAFLAQRIQGPLYRLHDIVLDVPSLLHTLARLAKGRVFQLDVLDEVLVTDAAGRLDGLHLPGGQRLQAQRFVFTGGAGNESLAKRFGQAQVTMQRRPLQMVIVKHRFGDPLFVHCVGQDFSATPELTITTHPCRDGRQAWYLGGEIAESGARLDSETLLLRARQCLAQRFPWCDFTTAEFSTLRIDRAEAQQPGGRRPDRDNVVAHDNLLFCWPTKLTLAPALAAGVLSELARQGVLPRGQGAALEGLPAPVVATAPWDA